MTVRLHIPKLHEIDFSGDTAHFPCDARDKRGDYSGDQDPTKQATAVSWCLFLSCLTVSKFLFLSFCTVEANLEVNSLNLLPQK